MKIFSNKSVIGRYHVIAFVFCLIGVVIVYRAIRTMFVEGDVWKAASEKFVKENVSVRSAAIYFRPMGSCWLPHCRNTKSIWISV